MKLVSLMRPLYGVHEHNTNTKNVLFLFLNLDTVLLDSIQENFATI